MTDRNTFLETALDSMPEGVAVFDNEGWVVLWNAAAEAITGYSAGELHAGPLPSGLKHLLHENAQQAGTNLMNFAPSNRGVQVRTRHKLGHEFSVIIRTFPLRERACDVIGSGVLFHATERLDALPHGETGEDQAAVSSQAEFEERLYSEYEDFERGGQPLSVLWIVVDQAHDLRRTHGVAACHAMFEKIQRALISGLRPGELLARWGEDEFLVAAHERTTARLVRCACALAGMARTADFRWWGDRISLTVSIGAAQACRHQPLHQLLECARRAMENSVREGGNRVTCAPRDNQNDSSTGEGLICTPS